MPDDPASMWLVVLGLASLSAATSWIGVALALRIGDRPRAVAAGIGFSAGIMIVISAAELIPEAYRAAGLPTVVMGTALGAGLLGVLHVVTPHIHLGEEAGGDTPVRVASAYLVATGLILHDFPEGFALANSYIANPEVGVLVAVAIAVHNIPEEFAMAVPAVALRRRRFLLGAAVVSALAEPVGALIGLTGVELYPSLNAAFLAFAAGAMIFVSVSELYPMGRRLGHLGHFTLGAATALPTYAALQLAIVH
ncbi:MAG TPA: ZIP family metal transporter [Acidimicrobiales bacterium]